MIEDVLKEKKMLIVDDDPSIVMSLEFLLRKSGSEVYIAVNGEEAIEQVKINRPDMVLLDIMMPGLNGYEVCEFIKQYHQDIKVIFISAKSRDEDIKLAYSKGADLFIIKPFSTRRLMDKIVKLISK